MSRLESHVATNSRHSASSLCKIELRGKGTGCHLNFTKTWSQISNVGAPGKHQAVERALKGLWVKGSRVIERLRKKELNFQEAFPRALLTFPFEPFGRSYFEQLSGWGECRENGRGMFYGVGVRRRCIYVALAGPAARWGLDGPGTLGTFLTNWLDPPSLSISSFPFFIKRLTRTAT